MSQDYFKNTFFTKFRLTGTQKERYWQIEEREIFEFQTGDGSEFSAVAAGSESSDVEIANLEPSENELYYIIPGIKDGLDYYLRIPAGTDRMGVTKDTDSGFINNVKSPYFLPNAQYSFFMAIKTKFTMRAVNDTPAAVTPKVYFEGMKYKIVEVTDEETLKKLDKGEIRHTPIQLGGFTR